MPRKYKKQRSQPDYHTRPEVKNYQAGCLLVSSHPIFGALYDQSYISRGEAYRVPQDGLAVVSSDGCIQTRISRLLEPEEWAYVLAHCHLHLAFGHFQEKYTQTFREWNAACDCVVAKFLFDLKFGKPPLELRGLLDDVSTAGFSVRNEQYLYEEFCIRGIPSHLFPTGTAGGEERDMIFSEITDQHDQKKIDWQECFSQGLQIAVNSAVANVGDRPTDLSALNEASQKSPGYSARNWFINNYPLLGALAASFQIIEDPLLCHRMDISIGAVDMEEKKIYINPRAGLTSEELRFVMAHELLHVGLRHDVRCGARDPYLWNVACDYVINDWLIEMGVGTIPAMGLLYDPTLKGESAEAIYDRIVCDLRRYRRLMTMRGTGASDILGKSDWWTSSNGTDLDEFYRGCLAQGLNLHQQQGRGFIAAGLLEEISALSQPPIPWDVELAQWFDDHFTPIEKVRSYARLSRRQSSTPDIPRPLSISPQQANEGRTFGVLLDTSGSMETKVLAKALGAIASYSITHEVPAVRVVFCDAITYDQGYMVPEAIAGAVKVRGRGGTILQPGIDLLEHAEDFPKDGPLLIITDGFCDRLRILREHAFLLPMGRSLPFPPKGPTFRIK